jgi:uncharacterized membrane protein
MMRWLEKHWMIVLGLIIGTFILLSILAAGYFALVAIPVE